MNDARDMIAIVGGTLIDGNGGPPVNDSVILIAGERITAVGDCSLEIPRQAKQISAKGKFIIPGLMDAYVWLIEGTVPMVLIRHEGRYAELALEGAQIALKNGVTTVFYSWGPRDELIKARNAIREGRAIGSRIYLCGNWIGLGGPFSPDMRQSHRVAVYETFAAQIDAQWECNVGPRLVSMSPEQVRQEVKAYLQSGVDYLSYAVSDHHIGALRFIVFSPRVQQVIVEEAHRAGLPVCGFRPATAESVHLALQAGVDMIHIADCTAFEPLPEETLALMAQQHVPCVIEAMTDESVERLRKVLGPNSIVDVVAANHQSMIRAGVPLLLGTGAFVTGSDNPDAHHARGTTKMLGDGHFVWFEIMQGLGMKPMAMLLAATRDVARAYKVDKDLGTLERGKVADLLILDRNPLESAENYRSLDLVVKEGRVVDRDTLPTQRLLTA